MYNTMLVILYVRRVRVMVRAVLMGTKSCTKILILLPKIFPTRFRFTFYG